MGSIIQSLSQDYQAYMNAARDRVGVDAEKLPNEKIDSISYLQSVEDSFIELLGADYYDNADAVTQRRIKLYLVLKTSVLLLPSPECAPIVREAEFGESVQYVEQDLQTRIDLINREISDLAAKIDPLLDPINDFMGVFEVINVKRSY